MNEHQLESLLQNLDSEPNGAIQRRQGLWTALTRFFKERDHSQPEQLASSTLKRIAQILGNQDIKRAQDWIWKEAATISRESRGFETLLQCLDADRDCAGKKYVDIRLTLMKFFQRNDCPAADDLTDRTLDRVAKILQRRKIDEVVPFIVGVAKNVRRESRKRPATTELKSEVRELCTSPVELALDSRRQYAELIRCIEKLEAQDRKLFREYFMSFEDAVDRKRLAEHRQHVAQQFGLTLGALHVKAQRLRSEVKRCCLRHGGVTAGPRR
jgi:hypothetical protein